MKIKPKERGWLKCRKIGQGMFPTEIIVSGETIDGRIFTLFADKSIVKPLTNDQIGLHVTILDLKENEAVVVLPDFPFEINRIIRVKPNNLLISKVIEITEEQLGGKEVRVKNNKKI